MAPVTKPGNGKPAKTEVFLPAGDDWIDYFTGDIYEGGQKIVHECPLARMPLFVRAGSIVPTGPKMDYSDQSPVDPLTLDVYAGTQSRRVHVVRGRWHVAGLPQRAYARPRSLWPAKESGDYTLTIGPVQGSFAGNSRIAAMWFAFTAC